MFRKVLVAIDGSPASEKALATAVDVAALSRAELVSVSVAQLPETATLIDEFEDVRAKADQKLHEIAAAAVAYARSRGVDLRAEILHGHVADTILKFAEAEAADLLVMGGHGHSRIARFFLGSTTDRVSEHCHCTVMIVK